jgi:hypothetical protein
MPSSPAANGLIPKGFGQQKMSVMKLFVSFVMCRGQFRGVNGAFLPNTSLRDANFPWSRFRFAQQEQLQRRKEEEEGVHTKEAAAEIYSQLTVSCIVRRYLSYYGP